MPNAVMKISKIVFILIVWKKDRGHKTKMSS